MASIKDIIESTDNKKVLEINDEFGFDTSFIKRNKLIYSKKFYDQQSLNGVINDDYNKCYFDNITLEILGKSDLDVVYSKLNLFPNLERIKGKSLNVNEIDAKIDSKLSYEFNTLYCDLEYETTYFEPYSDRYICNELKLTYTNQNIINIQKSKVEILLSEYIDSSEINRYLIFIKKYKMRTEIESVSTLELSISKKINIEIFNRYCYMIEKIMSILNITELCLLDTSNINGEVQWSNINIRKDLLNKIEHLNISNNNFEDLDQLSIDMPNLKSLTCFGTTFQNVPSINFKNMTTLEISYENLVKSVELNYENLSNLTSLTVIGRNVERIQLHESITLDKLILSNTNVKEIPLKDLPAIFEFDYTPLVKNDKLIERLIASDIQYSCMPKIVFNVNEAQVAKNLPNIAYLKDVKVENRQSQKNVDKILQTIEYSDVLHSEYSVNIGSDEEMKIRNRYSWIAIDGKWGNGKSHFFKNYVNPPLEEKGYKAICVSSISLLTSNVYMSIVNELEYVESTSSVIGRIIKRNPIEIKLLVKLYFLILLFLILLFIININFFYGSVNDAISYISVMVSLTIFPSVYFFTESLYQRDQDEKDVQNEINQQLMNLANEDNDAQKPKLILVVDDIERCGVETQINILNSLAKLNESIHIVLIADLNELKSALSNNYSSDTEFDSLISKYTDLQIDYDKTLRPDTFDYIDGKYYFRDEKLKRNIMRLTTLSNTLEDMPLRELDQLLIGTINRVNSSNRINIENLFYDALINVIIEKNNITIDIQEICIYFEMINLICYGSLEKLVTYSKYSTEEYLAYLSMHDKGNTGKIIEQIESKESICDTLFESHITNNIHCAYFNIEEFVDRYISSEFGMLLWKEVVERKYPEEVNSASILLNPNKAEIISFIKEHYKTRR